MFQPRGRERDVTLILDTVTSMGGIEVRTDEWELDYCLTGNHKCLGGPSGTGLIAVSDRAWEKMAARKIPVPGWFVNLQNIRRHAVTIDQQPAAIVRTMGTQRLRGYQQALEQHARSETDADVGQELQWALAEIRRDPVESKPAAKPE